METDMDWETNPALLILYANNLTHAIEEKKKFKRWCCFVYREIMILQLETIATIYKRNKVGKHLI